MELEIFYERTKTTWSGKRKEGRITVWHDEITKGCQGEKIGVIGNFEANSREVALELLENAIKFAEEIGMSYVIGPMDKNTWHHYRYQVFTELAMPFFMEPSQPADYVTWFEEAGFYQEQNYYSMITELKHFNALKWEIIETCRYKGIEIQDAHAFTDEELLKTFYEIASLCFQENVYYTSISEEEFRSIYMPYLPLLKKELVCFAMDGQKPVGFLFGIEDYYEVMRTGKANTVIFKTFGVLKKYRNRGIASMLMGYVAAVAKELGMKNGIMALVHENNYTMHMLPEQKICSKYCLFRRDCVGRMDTKTTK